MINLAGIISESTINLVQVNLGMEFRTSTNKL